MADIEKIMALAKEHYDKDEGGKALPLCHQAADAGDINALRMIGNIYRNGKGVDMDIHAAISWYKKAIATGDNDARFNLACVYGSDETGEPDFESAFQLFKECADAGDKEAYFFLGHYYYEGQGTEQDYEKAYHWLVKSAESGDETASYYLGLIYENGDGREQDYGKAFEWYEKAAIAGSAAGQYNLALSYYFGKGIEHDYKKAFKWAEKAARAGDADAQYMVGLMYTNGEGVLENSHNAVLWMKKAAEQEHDKAREWLGETFSGRITKFTTIEQLLLDLADEESATIPLPASEEDLEKCQKELAAKGFQPIPQEYINFLRKCNGFAWGLTFFGTEPISSYGNYAVWNGLVAANEYFAELECYDWLHHCLYIGEGCEKIFLYDPEKNLYRTWDYDAGLWDDYETFEAMFKNENGFGEDDTEPRKSMFELLEEAKQGDTEAMNDIGSRYHSGESVYDKAVEWYEYAAFLGNADAQTSLFNMYMNGDGVPKDKEKAVYWMQHSQKHYPFQQEYIDEYESQGYGLDPSEYVKRYSGNDEERTLYWSEKAAWTENPSMIVEKIKGMDELPDEDGEDGESAEDRLSFEEMKKIMERANEHYDKEEYEDAFPLFKEVAEAGYAFAQFYLGLMYYYGTGTKQDYGQAYKWYERSAYAGDSDAQLNLALMYFRGEYVQENMDAGMKWMEKSAKQGNEIAIENMKILNKESTEEMPDEDDEGSDDDSDDVEAMMEKHFEKPEGYAYCEKCETTNYIYDDMKPPYKCDGCGSLLEREDKLPDSDEDEKGDSKSGRYFDYIKERVVPSIDYKKLDVSYKTDMVYAKEILRRLHEAMIEVYGSDTLDADSGDDGFVLIPGMVWGMANSELCLAIFSLDLSSRGELWGAEFITEDGLSSQDKGYTYYVPYNYYYTANIPCDIHVEFENLPDELKIVFADYRRLNNG